MVFSDIISAASTSVSSVAESVKPRGRAGHVSRSGGTVAQSLAASRHPPGQRDGSARDSARDRHFGRAASVTSSQSVTTNGLSFEKKSGRVSVVSTAPTSDRTSVRGKPGSSKRASMAPPPTTQRGPPVGTPSVARSVASGVSPYDSVSVAGHGRRGVDPEFLSGQHAGNARVSSAELARRLGVTSPKVSEPVRRHLSTSGGQQHSSRSRATVITTVLEEPSMASGGARTIVDPTVVQPGSVHASQFGRADTVVSKLVIDKKLLTQMAGTDVLRDINLRVVDGHNIVVLKGGASLEVVDENGNHLTPAMIPHGADRTAFGLPPVTPRDLHDRLRGATGGKLGVVRSGNAMTVVDMGSGSAAPSGAGTVKKSRGFLEHIAKHI